MADEITRNPASEMEPAEGSRENVNVGVGADSPMERGSGQESDPERPIQHGGRPGGGRPPEDDGDNAGGITNRPLSEEEEEEQRLPPRGEARKP